METYYIQLYGPFHGDRPDSRHPGFPAGAPDRRAVSDPRRHSPELEWFANLTNANTRRAYRQDIQDFIVFAGLRQPEQFRDVRRAHVIAWICHPNHLDAEIRTSTIPWKLLENQRLFAPQPQDC
jgi:hypothetical protein